MNPEGTTMTDKKMKDLLEENRKLKEKLAESEKRIKFLEDEEMTAFIIGDAVSDGICMVDNKGIVTRINRGYTEITGITEEEILGKSIQEMLDNGDFSNAVSLEVIRKKEKASAMANVRKGNKQVLLVGSPFLDEIGDMPMKLQTKLLRVLQERELTRVGGTESIKIDARVIVSTNEKLEELIRQNRFRADLYYRLNVFPIKLPSLRERREDIPDLAAEFLAKFNLLYNKNKSFSSSALTALMNYEWPGNVRELENIIERKS